MEVVAGLVGLGALVVAFAFGVLGGAPKARVVGGERHAQQVDGVLGVGVAVFGLLAIVALAYAC